MIVFVQTTQTGKAEPSLLVHPEPLFVLKITITPTVVFTKGLSTCLNESRYTGWVDNALKQIKLI